MLRLKAFISVGDMLSGFYIRGSGYLQLGKQFSMDLEWWGELRPSIAQGIVHKLFEMIQVC